MGLQYSAALRNAQLDAIETAIGTTPKLRIYSGAVPANCAASIGASLVLLEEDLPSDWMGAASGGSKAKSGTWSAAGLAAAGTGTPATYYRIWDAAGTTCFIQGTITAAGGGGDMTMDNTSIAENQVVTVNTYSIAAGNA